MREKLSCLTSWDTRMSIKMCGARGGERMMLERIYVVTYTNGRGESQTERGRLIALDQEGFVVLEVNGKHVLVPKARVDALVEVA